MMYDQLTEAEQDRITEWLVKRAKFEEGGWIVTGLVNLIWCGGWPHARGPRAGRWQDVRQLEILREGGLDV